MDAKLLARLGSAVFVGGVIAVAVVATGDGRRLQRSAPVRSQPADALVEQLRQCSRMGDAARDAPPCRKAWAAERCRFFGGDGSGIGIAPMRKGLGVSPAHAVRELG